MVTIFTAIKVVICPVNLSMTLLSGLVYMIPTVASSKPAICLCT